MPTKRRRSVRRRKSTKGAGQKPQTLVMQKAIDSADVWNTTFVELPLLNIQHNFNTIEIVQIDVTNTGTQAGYVAIGGLNLNGVTAATFSPTTNAFTDKRLFWTALVQGGQNTLTFDTTDDAGRGIMYPAQKIFMNVLDPTAQGTNFNAAVKIYYKLRTASAAEQLLIINQYIVTN